MGTTAHADIIVVPAAARTVLKVNMRSALTTARSLNRMSLPHDRDDIGMN